MAIRKKINLNRDRYSVNIPDFSLRYYFIKKVQGTANNEPSTRQNLLL